MALTESQVLATELERVREKVPTLFDRDALFYSSVEKRPVEVISNRDMRIPLEIRPGGRFGHFDPDGGDLGRGDGPTFDKAVINTVHLKHGVEWTKKAEWATDDRRKAVIKTFQHLLAKSMAEFRRHVDSLCMTGGNGVLGTVSAVSNAGGFDTVTLGTDGFGSRLLRYGQYVNYYDSALTTHRTSGGEKQITFHDLEAKQIKTATTASLQQGDKVVVSGVSGATPVSMFGVPYHHNSASSGYWLGFDRSTNPEIRANRVNANGALALSHARLAMNKIGNRLGMEQQRSVKAWMHPCQKQAYEEMGQLVQVINRSPNASGGGNSFDLYFNGNLTIAGAPIKESFSWDKTRIDFVLDDVWGRAEFHPAGFYEVEGRKIFELRGASGGVATGMIFYIVASFNLFVDNPAACSYIDGLSVPSGY